MKTGKIGVGIVGIEPGRSWSAIAHVPALRALPHYEITALGTTRQASADAAARALGVPHAFADHRALVAHPDVDLVVVTVKVPHHLELVTAALEAGKSVYCEWPLGNGLDEAERMAELARRKGVCAVVGLQARMAPVVAYVRQLVATGYVGEVLSSTLVGSGMNWGAYVDRANAYTLDRRNGATLLSIPFGHTVDALCHVLGGFTEVQALMANRRHASILAGTAESVPMSAEDQIVAGGTLAGGAVVSIHYRGGMTAGTGLLWEINGTGGDLQVSAVGGHAQLLELALRGGQGGSGPLQTLEVPEAFRPPPRLPVVAYNVAQVYVALAEELRGGARRCAGFDEAVRVHRLLAAVEKSAASGQRVPVPGA